MENNKGVEIVTSSGVKNITPVIPLAPKSSKQQISSPQSTSDKTYRLFVTKQRQTLQPSSDVAVRLDAGGPSSDKDAQEQAQAQNKDLKQKKSDKQTIQPKETVRVEGQVRQHPSQLPHSRDKTSIQTSSESKALKADIMSTPQQLRSPTHIDMMSKQSESGNQTVHDIHNPHRTPKQIQMQLRSSIIVDETSFVKVQNSNVVSNGQQCGTAPINQPALPQHFQQSKSIGLPNLKPRQRDLSGAVNNNAVISQTSIRKSDFAEKKYASTGHKDESQTLIMMRGNQNFNQPHHFQTQSSNVALEQNMLPQSPRDMSGGANKMHYRKGSHQQPIRYNQQALQSPNQLLNINNRSNGKVQSYGQLPKIYSNNINNVASNSACDAKQEIQIGKQGSSTSQVNLLKMEEKINHGLEQAMQPFQGGGPVYTQQELSGQEFQQWYKTPNFQMQGRGIYDNEQLKQCSIEQLQKIRAQAVIAPSRINSVANQFQPNTLSIQTQHSRNQAMFVNAVSSVNSQGKQIKLPQQKTKQLTLKGQNGVLSPPSYSGNVLYTQTYNESKKLENSPLYMQQEAGASHGFQQHTNAQQPMIAPPNTTSTMRQSETGSRFQQQRKTIGGGPPNTEQNSSMTSTKQDTMKQEEQIKSSNMSTQHKDVQEPSIMDRVQINSTVRVVQDDKNLTKNAPLAINSAQMPQTKQIQKLSSGRVVQKTGSKKFTQEGKQHRQQSQAQKNNRGSLVDKESRGRKNNRDDSNVNNRTVIMNSPLMQPPPQILQSKIIIHLLRTEYPLIEEVAKQVMGWRVTKSENPNAEFDIYWNDIGIDVERLTSLKPYQKTNHFPAMFQITRKTFLAKNLKRLQRLYPAEFDFFPKTWIVPNELNELRTFATQKMKKLKSKPSVTTLNSPQSVTTPLKASSKLGLISPPTTGKKTSGLEASDPPPVPSQQQPVLSKNGHDDLGKNGYISSADLRAGKTSPTKPPPVAVGTGLIAPDDDSSEMEVEEEEIDEESVDSNKDSPIPKEPIVHRDKPKELRKAPLACKMRNKTRIPLIVKPDCMSQGKGIFLTNDIDQIPRDDTYVVQQYMQNPYLLDGLKFDLRLYVLVLSCEPLKIFLYQEGLVRFATHQYKPIDANSDKNTMSNLFMHLTNYAVNKENENFKMAKGMNDDTSHKRTLKKVFERLKEDGLDTEKCMSEIKDIITKTLITIQHELAHNYRTCQPADLESLMCFEILGFDIILDDKGKPLLLEVNQAPSFATDSPLDYEIKKGLFVDTFRLLGLSVEKKKAKVKRLYEEKKDRMLTKLTLKQKNVQRRHAINEFKKEQDIFEAANLGRFEKIYPLPVKEAADNNLKAQENPRMSLTQKQLALLDYQALARQQERFNQLLATLGNTDIEKAIRAKNRQDDQKEKDEKEKQKKLKLKKQEKSRQDKLVATSRLVASNGKKVDKDSTVINATQPIKLGDKPEESIEQAMRASITKPPGIPDTQSQDSKLRKSIGERFSENKSHSTTARNKDSNHRTSVSLIKKTSQQQIINDKQQVSLRESINSNKNTLQTNMQIRHLIEMQQRMQGGGSDIIQEGQMLQLGKEQKVSGRSNETSNLANYVQPGVGHGQSLTGRIAQTKKQMVVSDYLSNGTNIIDGLKPNIQQLQYQNVISQSQNPINPQKLKSGEYDLQMNRTTGLSDRQGNLLPNIAKNMMPTEKRASGFASQQNPATNTNLIQQQQELLYNHSQIAASNQQKQQRFRGSIPNHTPHQQLIGGALTQPTSAMSSPKRSAIERAHFQRTSVQHQHQQLAAANNQPMTMKTQQMNLGTMNIQPVIIDSNHFNQAGGNIIMSPHNPKNPVQALHNAAPNNIKTTKFSKIQLQNIIDNLYVPQDKHGAKTTSAAAAGAQRNDPMSNQLANVNMSAAAQMHFPDVTPNENIHKHSSLANRALNAIVQQKATAAAAASIQQDGQNFISSSDLNSYAHIAQQPLAVPSPGLASLMSPKKLSISGAAGPQPQQPQQSAQAQSTAAPQPPSVINFSNCNVTIINNNYDPNNQVRQGAGAAGATIIQSSLISRPLNGAAAAAKQQAQASAAQSQLAQINEVPIASQGQDAEQSPGRDEN